MSLNWNWINPNDYSFNAFLLLERFQIKSMMESCGWLNDNEKWKLNMGIALNANPTVKWYFLHRCPECASIIEELATNAPITSSAEQVKSAEEYALLSVEDFTIHTTPELMSEKCAYIHGWNKERLFELVDLTGKIVLDVGAGSGRLAFAAAEKATWVCASEPVGTMREFMRNKIKNDNIINMRVLDGLIWELPFPDNTFDIVMSGHVISDDIDEVDAEIAELTRVCKSGGWLVDCVGDSTSNINPKSKMTSRGFEEIRYVGSFGKLVCNYRKQIRK